ncbi:hypothetical protein AAFF_G00234340 [Aldrovandia affinis]|uniref:Uncharacterized protein n=1 Tax=Aldrovandia affinis TaxID=143900 RepID=A0AAD7SWQ5_9TELE|nr:hypothetical protein AAFF_G00234340 [Aldrovandia affinis]
MCWCGTTVHVHKRNSIHLVVRDLSRVVVRVNTVHVVVRDSASGPAELRERGRTVDVNAVWECDTPESKLASVTGTDTFRAQRTHHLFKQRSLSRGNEDFHSLLRLMCPVHKIPPASSPLLPQLGLGLKIQYDMDSNPPLS